LENGKYSIEYVVEKDGNIGVRGWSGVGEGTGLQVRGEKER
jgi:hypothetical protein